MGSPSFRPCLRQLLLPLLRPAHAALRNAHGTDGEHSLCAGRIAHHGAAADAAILPSTAVGMLPSSRADIRKICPASLTLITGAAAVLRA